MVLTNDQVDQFRQAGYTKSPEFFSPREIQAMLAELYRLNADGLLRNIATEGDGTTHSKRLQNYQICPITPKSDLYRAFHFHPKVIRAVGQLIGNPFVFYLDQIFLKPGKHGIGTDWHQDNAYFKVEDATKGVAIWVALHDASIENGTLHVLPNSHTKLLDHERDPNSDHHIRCVVPEEEAVALELAAGGVGFFDFGTAHCTRANTTNTARAGLAVHFLHTDFIPESRSSIPTHLTGPHATSGVKEYGRRIEGTWELEVDRVLGATRTIEG